MTEKQDIGALCYVFAKADGTFGIISFDRTVEAWSSTSFDQAWSRYYSKARRQMAKTQQEPLSIPREQSDEEEAPDEAPAVVDDGDGFQEV